MRVEMYNDQLKIELKVSTILACFLSLAQLIRLFDCLIYNFYPILLPGSFQPSNEMKLQFYAYYKQATQGPCKADRPGFWDIVARWLQQTIEKTQKTKTNKNHCFCLILFVSVLSFHFHCCCVFNNHHYFFVLSFVVLK